jgi:hypothetical protein
MLVGSKVRMLHGREEGIVTRVDGEKLTILLQQGLEIPMHKRDVVLISAAEEKVAPASEPSKSKSELPKSAPGRLFFVKDGVFLASFPGSAMLSEFALVNFTDYQVFVVAYKLGRPLNHYYGNFLLAPKSHVILPDPFPNQVSHHWVGMQFQMLKFSESQGDAKSSQEFRLSFSDQVWKKSKTKVPVLEKEGYLLQLDGDAQTVNPEELKNSLLTPKEKTPPAQVQTPEKKLEWREIDLHIEKLHADPGTLPASEIFDIQLKAFDKALDRALAEGIGSLIAIHGVGNGVLKNEIHKRVAGHPHVDFFREGRKEKFGYGATEIKFKS